jgi:septum formation protein
MKTPALPVVLASTSRYRRTLLERLELQVIYDAPPYDEDAAKEALLPCPVERLVLALAEGKARSLAARHPEAVILAADQMGELDGELLGKPGTAEAARAQLRRLAGRSHRQVTGMVALEPSTGRLETTLDVHTLVVRALSDEAIADYVARDAPLDSAGSYRIESLGIALFERISGDDATGVVGLSLTKVVDLLGRFGVTVLG